VTVSSLAIAPFAIEDGSAVTGAPLDPVSELVLRAQAGDRPAFGALYERFGALVHGVLLARVSAEEARDLVQEVFLVALRRLEELREPGRIGPWLAAIARSRAADQTRRRHLAREEALAADEALPAPRASGTSGEAEEAARALAELRALPEAYRETLALRLVEGLSGAEIAARCGLTEGSVRVNLHRGMQILRARLAEPHEGARR
jgi:RNA polymerase sigma-70 factor (ECF subfamily)